MVSGAAFSEVRWKKSSASGADGCFEVARAADGSVLVRNSKDPAGTVQQFSASEWTAFAAGMKAGEFDDI